MAAHGIDRSGAAGSGGSSFLSSLQDLTDPGADRILFWDDSAGIFTWLTAGTGLTITDTTITADFTSASLLAGSNAFTGAVTVVDNVFSILDNSDNTKKIAFQASGITTGTTRTLTIPDADITVAGINNKQTWTKQQTPLKAALSDASSTTWDCDVAQVATWTIGGNRSLAAATNQVAGTFYTLVVAQDGTGGRTITWNSIYKFQDGADESLSTGASDVDIFTFYSDGTSMYCVGVAKDLS